MQPQYPAQYPAQPQYPAPIYPVQQPYAQLPAPTYPQQQPAYPQAYAQPQYAAPAPPAAPLPTGTLDGYYQQPSSSGGPSFKFNGKPIGTSYAGIVARPVTDSDIRAQTNNAGQVQTYKDGRAKFVMVVPMQVQPSPEFPEGTAGWWVKGQARDELARAMAEAGAPAGAPEAGAGIRVTLVGQRQVPNMNPQLLYRIDYMRPGGAAPVPAPQPVAQPAPVQQMQQPGPQSFANLTGGPPMQATPTQGVQFAPAPVVQQIQQPMPQPAPVPQAAPQPAPVPVQQPAPVPVQQPAPMPVPVGAPAATPAGFSPEQAELFAKLTGQPAS